MRAIAAISLIPFMYIYIKAYYKGNMELSKAFFYSGLSLFCLIFCAYITGSIDAFYFCSNQRLWFIFFNFFMQFYLAEGFIFLGILFFRLHSVLVSSALALSQFTVRTFFTSYTVMLICAVLSGVLYASHLHRVKAAIFISIVGLLGIMLAIFIVCLYIYKLAQVHRATIDSFNDKDEMIRIITKTSLLCFIACLTCFLTAISLILSRTFSSIHLDFIHGIIHFIDMYTRFICIYLSFSYFDSQYMKLCGCCDKYCDELCTECLHKINQREIIQELEISSIDN